MKFVATTSIALLLLAVASFAQPLTLIDSKSAGATNHALFLVDAAKLRNQSVAQAKAHLVSQLAPFGLTPAYVASDFNTTPIVCGPVHFGSGQLWTYDHGILPLQTVEDGPEQITLDRGVAQVFGVNFRTPFTIADPYDPGHDVHVHFDAPMSEFGFVASFTSAAGGQLLCDTVHITAYSDTNHDGTLDTLRADFVPTVDQIARFGVSIPTGFTDIDFVPRYAVGLQGVLLMSQSWYLPWVATAGVGDDPVAGLALSAPTPSPAHGDVSVQFTLPISGRVTAQLYDASGRLVRTLLDEVAAPGMHRAQWDGHTASGARAEAGVYFMRIAHAGKSATKKVVQLQ